ncbi:hypothetical protein [Phytohabitans kaempferiae]|uniref:Nitroreductase domain-containing protein n=1 Tax=Phytohabitans kaempferiae TaxID=1620943 RepID=A0ABV6LZ06_9ACTN
MITTGYDTAVLDKAVRTAIRAPSMHNSQPWRFRLRDGGIEVRVDRERLRTALGRFGVPQMVMRIGYGQPGVPTPRRAAAEVVDERDGAPTAGGAS